VDGNVLTLPDSGQSQIGWSSGSGVTTYKSTPAFVAATGQGTHDVDRPSASSAAAAAAATAAGAPLPLPADVAAVAGQPAGTRHVGVF
jgi:hypothetical protein